MNEDELVAAITKTEDDTQNKTLAQDNDMVTDETFAELGLDEAGDEDADEQFNEAEDDGESLDVEEWEHNGDSYLVCRDTLAIYNEEGEEVGKWGEGATEGAPVPEEE